MWDLPESSDVIRRHTWSARHGSCRGCIEHMNQPRVMQYVNETVVEVNLPAVISTLHVKSTAHDPVITHAHTSYTVFSQSASDSSISSQSSREYGKNMDEDSFSRQPC